MKDLFERVVSTGRNRTDDHGDEMCNLYTSASSQFRTVQSVAETILRTAKDGERDPKVLERMALLELQISPRQDH